MTEDEIGLYNYLRIKKSRVENAHTKTLIFNATLKDAYPGQFVMAWLPGIGEKPFSISGNDPLSLTICDVGPLSHALCQLVEGAPVWVRGPFGQGFKLVGESHILVGGGYGAAPLYYLAQQARQLSHKVQVCLGAKTKADLLMVQQFKDLGCQVSIATEDGSLGELGFVTQALKKAAQSQNPAGVYACGPTGMLLAVNQFCQDHQIPSQLSFEALIRCGIGLCGSCELPERFCTEIDAPRGWLVCKDGPVFQTQTGSIA